MEPAAERTYAAAICGEVVATEIPEAVARPFLDARESEARMLQQARSRAMYLVATGALDEKLMPQTAGTAGASGDSTQT